MLWFKIHQYSILFGLNCVPNFKCLGLTKKSFTSLTSHTPLSPLSDLPLRSVYLFQLTGMNTQKKRFMSVTMTGLLRVLWKCGVSLVSVKCLCVCVRESGAGLYQPLQAAALCIVPSACCPSSLQQCLTVWPPLSQGGRLCVCVCRRIKRVWLTHTNTHTTETQCMTFSEVLLCDDIRNDPQIYCRFM